jgi:hypothetical protein
MAIDYRDEAALKAFPNVKTLGLKVRHKERSSDWVVDALELEEYLKSINSSTWWDRNGIWIVYAVYALLFLAAYFRILPAWVTRAWY